MSLLRPPLNPNDHLRGHRGAPMRLVEFGDYECPFCGQAHPIVEALREALGDRLVFAFRHFPLTGAHPHALLASEAAEAAGAQGRFWEMHDQLYTHQEALELPFLEEYAALLELDVPRFLGDLQDHRYADKIRADLHSGAVSGVNGTPSFFVNNQRHDGPWDYDSLLAALTAAGGVEIGA
jgi:protein-disulfide isomerase